jgi:regulator of ribonuclease activity A
LENAFSTADLCDLFLQRPDGLQVVAPGFRSFGGRKAYWGQIATARPAVAGGSAGLRELLTEPGKGRVLVVDGGADDRWAIFGDQLAALGHRNGWAGIVVNGYVRDISALASIDMGVHALGTMPCRPREFGAVECDLAVSFNRTRFEPGSWLYADEDGIIVCSEQQSVELQAASE